MPRNKYQVVDVLPPASQFGRGESIIYQGEVLTSDGVNWTSQTGPLSYDAGDLPDPATLGAGSMVAVGTNVAMAIGGNWCYISQAKGAIVLDSSTNGDDSGWLPSSVNPERFGFLLTGASAVVAITGSDDAASVASGYAVTITMDTAASTLVTPPMNFDYKFIKFTVMSLGAASSIKVLRGV